MAEISAITGYAIHAPFSDFGGNAGQSSTTTGVGGVGAYHRRHQPKTTGSQDPTDPSSSALGQENDLFAPSGSSSPTSSNSSNSAVADQSFPLLTGDGQTALSGWLASYASQGDSLGSPGQLLDTLA